LFLNGQSLGRQTITNYSHLHWAVKYAPGVLSAKGYTDGKVVAETKVETTGDPAAVQLTPACVAIRANGEDVNVITVSVSDAQHRIVPVASNLVHFTLSGPGKILGVGNGDPSCHELDVYIPQLATHSIPENTGWRWKQVPNIYDNRLAEFRTDFDDSSWDKTDVQSDNVQWNAEEQAVFRTKITVSESDLAAPALELCFGRIHNEGFIYVNGRRVGESNDPDVPASFDVKSFLHSGENTIAVGVANWGGPGGITKGMSLRIADHPILPEWKRSVFNGLAQILVQSTREPGEIQLTASADGLSPATVTIQSQPCAPRPLVP